MQFVCVTYFVSCHDVGVAGPRTIKSSRTSGFVRFQFSQLHKRSLTNVCNLGHCEASD